MKYQNTGIKNRSAEGEVEILSLNFWNFNWCVYSEICHERPLPWETTCIERPDIPARRSHISMQLSLSPKTTC